MATRAPVRPHGPPEDRRAPTDLRDQAYRALRDRAGVDVTEMSRADRDKLLSERFGI